MEDNYKFSFEKYLNEHSLHVEETPEKGRHIICDKDILMSDGNNIIESLPFTFVPFGDDLNKTCSYCLKTKSKVVRCSRCKCVLYCCAECQKLDWPNHKLECKSLAAIAPNRPSPTVLLLSRLVRQLCLVKKACTYKNPDENTRLGDPLQGTCEDVIHLAFHMEGITPDEEAQYQNTCMLVRRLVNNEEWSKDHEHGMNQYLLVENMITLIRRILCNSLTIQDHQQRTRGLGVYPVFSLLNHSCTPNTFIIFNQAKVILRPLRDIKKGEEITVSYIDQYQPTFKRQEGLKKNYGFSCTCPRCTSPNEKVETLYQTLRCMDKQCQQLALPLHNTMTGCCQEYQCVACKKTFTWKEFQETFSTKIDLAKNVLEDERVRKEDGPNVVKDMNHVIDIYNTSTSPSFYETLSFYKYALYYLLQYGDYENAKMVASTICKVYSDIAEEEKEEKDLYQPYNPNLSLFLAIQGKIYFLNREYKTASKFFEDSMAQISVLYGRTSPLYKEIHELYQNCNVLTQADGNFSYVEE